MADISKHYSEEERKSDKIKVDGVYFLVMRDSIGRQDEVGRDCYLIKLYKGGQRSIFNGYKLWHRYLLPQILINRPYNMINR